MVRFKLAFLFIALLLLGGRRCCELKVSAFRAYQNNFVVFEITYEGSPRSIAIRLGVDQPVLNIENVNRIESSRNKVSRHGVNLQPLHLRVGDKIYYKLFMETQDGRGNCETATESFQIQGEG
uniref:CBM39 domain-containing protein n=1 Tax=Photinus pyralis TaxID=7054 RepID=A0A1Y1M7U9_PHOPY